MKLHWLLIFLVILFIDHTTFAKSDTTATTRKPITILFVGNSLTYTNDMPQILAFIMKRFDKPVKMISLCKPNYALEDHWNDGEVQRMIKKKKIKYVIIQQGPSSQTYGKQSLITYGEKFQKICKKVGATLGFYMVWPARVYYRTFDGVVANYTNAAKRNGALLFPVGVVWRAYQKRDLPASLYGFDNFHPSSTGSFLAALTIFHALYPAQDLTQMKLKHYRPWITDQASFETMIELVVKN
ncbi:hypothetical protein BKI52_02130 [marine bacterium AO1-C]|nr:hypothetical protein BKI52_02130 [marine bacterium AO1-C]